MGPVLPWMGRKRVAPALLVDESRVGYEEETIQEFGVSYITSYAIKPARLPPMINLTLV